jgi:hypothetical protein
LENERVNRIFIPDKLGFKELTDKIENTSINGISEYLVYHPDQSNTYFGDFDVSAGILNVIVEVFTRNIIFVLTSADIEILEKKKVDDFLVDFQITEVFDSINTENILQSGIKNKSLRIEFLSRVLSIRHPDPNGMFSIESINSYLYFIDGFLVNFQSSNGLSANARQCQEINPELISSYEKVARLYWQNDLSKIINEINIQINALCKVPNASNNEYIRFHETEFNTVNFAMLLVCHYENKIELREFFEINHGRYKLMDYNEYKVGRFLYKFNEDGNFIASRLSE